MSHTPGPWVRSTHGFNVVNRPPNWEEGRSICAVHPEGISRDEHIANAALISAAPDLLEALECIFDAAEARYDEYGESDHADIKKARAAIAKAKGQGE